MSLPALRRLLRPSLLSYSVLSRSIIPTVATRTALLTTSAVPSSTPPPPPPVSAPSTEPTTLTSSDLNLLPLLRAQPQHYATIHIQGFPFLVTAGDQVTLPFRLKDVTVGDQLRITHVSVLGSRDYTLKGAPWIDEKLFEVRATVIEETSEPMRIKKKKKQRTRRTKTVKSKHFYTVLRVSQIDVLEQ
ncbi:hypothetical protein EX30DRAFT_338821 [Ascodesmis nigricans]|uniref:Large ribosomal subunit protein bL21m n=1 Tax=Ascodesmis nigricans TaxID=341454 RepID=A0A4S2N4U5_9PEZI|nr:hypothetical protein EX30DRAFT_338821 [Ascodesmis nigricans]